MKKILVTGANGLLGQHLISRLGAGGYRILAAGRGVARIAFEGAVEYHSVDLTDFSSVRQLIKTESPDIIVHAAAMTQVDECELNRDSSRLINVSATANLLEAAAGCRTHFIFLSTDFVFDGVKGNYREDDEPHPVNWYGETKLMGEQLVGDYPGLWSIARTCLLYGIISGSSRSNIISWIISSLKKNHHIRVVNDQVRTPTLVSDFAKGIQLIIEKQAPGCFHLSGREIMTPYQLAIETADYFSLDRSLIEAVDAGSFSQPGQRPLKTGFVIEKAERLLDFSPVDLQAGLKSLGDPFPLL